MSLVGKKKLYVYQLFQITLLDTFYYYVSITICIIYWDKDINNKTHF